MRVARASHISYAYRLETPEGLVEHFEDDGEFGAGFKLLKQLRDERIVGQLVCVSRWNGTRHMGPDRFDRVRESATLVLQM